MEHGKLYREGKGRVTGIELTMIDEYGVRESLPLIPLDIEYLEGPRANVRIEVRLHTASLVAGVIVWNLP